MSREELGPWSTEFRGRISTEADAKVQMRGKMTKQAARKLIQALELLVDNYPDEPGVSIHEAQQPAQRGQS